MNINAIAKEISFPLKNGLTLFFIIFLTNLTGQSSLVWLQNGTLQYQSFAMTGQANAVNTIPDFSFAGYKGGGVTIPEVPVVQTLSPSGGDDTPFIQQAIDAVEALPPDANGFRGAVLLQAGCYEISQLTIQQSGVVLRGEGQGLDGTILNTNLQVQHNAITIQGSGSGFSRNTSTRQDITSAYVPVGAFSFDIADASAYSIGDTIVVRRTPNQFWIEELGMDEATLCANDPGDCNGWTTSSYSIYHERVITNISGNTITVNLPIVDVIETQYGGGEVYKVTVPGRIEQCGVERLRIVSYYDPLNEEDENHAWVGVVLSRVVNSWVRNVTGQYLGYGTVSISGESNFNTIQECAAIDHKSQISGGRRYSFNISDGVGNLFQRNYTRTGRHDFVTGSRVTGPNVFLDSYSTITYADIGPHHRWATGILFDNIRGGQIRVQNRGSSGSGHGWAGNTNMFWNLISDTDDIKVESPLGGMNWGIGCSGQQQNGAGFWESWNSPVLPRSLYLQQLEDRLGTQAVENVTIAEQRAGTIYDLLAAWAGEGEFGEPSSTQTIYPSEDAYVRGGTNSTTNYGTSDGLNIKENSGSSNNDRRSFLKFNLNGVTGTMWNARLRLNVSNTPPGAAQCNLHLVANDSWTEGAIHWDNQPSAGNLIATASIPSAGNWVEFDVTAAANAELLGDKILSLRLSEGTIDNLFAFSSKEENDAGRRPRIEYSLSSDGGVTQSCMTALPVEWLYFTASPQGQTALLHWGTAHEEGHDRFIVEHSVDGKIFDNIGEVYFPEREENGEKEYQFIHERPLAGVNYYRIQQLDFDGRRSNSVIRAVSFGHKGHANLEMFPNPTLGNLQVRLPALVTATQAKVYSATGQLMLVHKLSEEEQSFELETKELAPGIYFLVVNGWTQRFIKNR